jgi:IS5 family transposase
MKAHIGVDADSGLVHTVTTTPAHEAEINEVEFLLHGKEQVVHADAGYTGADKRVNRKGSALADRGQAWTHQGTARGSAEARRRSP